MNFTSCFYQANNRSMVKTFSNRTFLIFNNSLELFKPVPMVLLLTHLFFFSLIDSWMPVLFEIKSHPESFLVSTTAERYDFSFGHQFNTLSLDEIEKIEKKEVKRLLLQSFKTKLKSRVSPVIDDALRVSEFYKIDPIWFLSVMMVESHFNQKATSSVRAQGLMQIMPGTAHHIFHRMNRPVTPQIAEKMMQDKRINMELGAYYLKYLLKKFNYDYKLATIAYNMGPYWVIREQRAGREVGNRNYYWNKIKRAYRQISKPYRVYAKNQTRMSSL